MIDTDGNWEDVVSRLDSEFTKVFRCNPRRQFEGKPIVYNSSIKDGDIEEGVWHVISKGNPRLFDPERARRLSWIQSMLEGTAQSLSRWRYVEGDGTVKIYLWLEFERYVVILAEKKHVVVLVTAFYVSQAWTIRDLDKKRSKGYVF
ncbi:hypothetical protein [Roseovarius sp. MBR-6]|jgi:hypothetical protein|uniref:hypothetical protein n=1 Tax=Roseovarius sp. MBR-6 TaxID=3156459 RepID=UPI00339946FF